MSKVKDPITFSRDISKIATKCYKIATKLLQNALLITVASLAAVTTHQKLTDSLVRMCVTVNLEVM